MFRQGEPDLPSNRHSPPAAAQPLASSLLTQEPAPSTARPVARLGAYLILGSGLLALFGLFLNLSLFSVPMVCATVLAIGGVVEGGALLVKTSLRATNLVMLLAGGGLAVQLIDGLFRLSAGIGHSLTRLETGYAITAASFLIMFACGWLIQVAGKPTVTAQEASCLPCLKDKLADCLGGGEIRVPGTGPLAPTAS